MPFTLEEIAPWGREFDEYAAMFALSYDDLGQRILGCGDGPASFNATLTRAGGRVVSVDPLYQFAGEAIRRRIDEVRAPMMAQTRANAATFVWNYFPTPEALEGKRVAAMTTFLEDFPRGMREGRYRTGELPRLDFADGEFGIALCSHLLFLYSEHLSLEFHVRSILELARLAADVRIFPLLELGAGRSRHLDPVVAVLREANLACEIETVQYEFRKGGNQMLRVRPRTH